MPIAPDSGRTTGVGPEKGEEDEEEEEVEEGRRDDGSIDVVENEDRLPPLLLLFRNTSPPFFSPPRFSRGTAPLPLWKKEGEQGSTKKRKEAK